TIGPSNAPSPFSSIPTRCSFATGSPTLDRRNDSQDIASLDRFGGRHEGFVARDPHRSQRGFQNRPLPTEVVDEVVDRVHVLRKGQRFGGGASEIPDGCKI